MKKCFQFPNKKRFNTKKDADKAILLTSNNNLYIYYCDSCYGWHLASKDK